MQNMNVRCFISQSAATSLFLLAVCLAVTPLVRAQQDEAGNKYELKGVTDRPDAMYHMDELVKFEFTLSNNGEPVSHGEVTYFISKDGQWLSDGTKAISNGRVSLSGQMSEPGFLRCRVTYVLEDGSKLISSAAAGIDPLQIKPGTPAPDDFDAFWNAQKQKLASIPMEPLLTPVESRGGGIEVYDLRLNCLESIAPVSGFFAKPKDAQPKSLPAMMRVHGAGIWSASRWDAIKGAEMGMLSVDINAHGVANEKPREYYVELEQTLLKGYSHRGREDRESCYFFGMYMRLVRAMDFLCAQPEWDGQVLIVKGVSQGGAQTIAAAGLDSRVSMIGAGVPALCNQPGPVSGWPWLVPGYSDRPDPKILKVSRYFDPVNFAGRTEAEAVFSVGFVDVVCPPSTVYMAYNNIKGKKRMVNEPLMGHASPEYIKDIFTRIFQTHVQEVKKIKTTR